MLLLESLFLNRRRERPPRITTNPGVGSLKAEGKFQPIDAFCRLYLETPPLLTHVPDKYESKEGIGLLWLAPRRGV